MTKAVKLSYADSQNASVKSLQFSTCVVVDVYAVSSTEVSDVVYLLTTDDDGREARWTVATNATPVKKSWDTVSYEMGRLVRGRSVNPLKLLVVALLHFECSAP